MLHAGGLEAGRCRADQLGRDQLVLIRVALLDRSLELEELVLGALPFVDRRGGYGLARRHGTRLSGQLAVAMLDL